MGVELAARLGDQVLDGAVHATQHVHHLDLVARGAGHGLGHGQRAHAGGGHARAAVHHLAPGFLEHIQRQVAVGAHGLLGQHVLQVLAGVEQHLLLQRLGALGVGGPQRFDLGHEPLIQHLRKAHGAGELLHGVPQLGAGGFNLDHIALHFVTGGVELLHAFLQLAARAFKAAKVVLQPVAKGDEAQQLLRLEQVALFAGVERVQLAAHVLDGAKGGAIFHAHKVALHEAPLHQAGGHRDFFTPQGKGAVELGAKAFALHVFGHQAIDKAAHLVFHSTRHFRGQGHGRAGHCVADGLHHLGWGQHKGACGDCAGHRLCSLHGGRVGHALFSSVCR